MSNRPNENGVAGELKSVAEIVTALRRLPNDVARVRAIGAAIALLTDSVQVEVLVTKLSMPGDRWMPSRKQVPS